MGIVPNYASSVALLERYGQPLRQKRWFALVASYCGNAVATFMQEVNRLRAPIARDLASKRNENVVTSQLLVFIFILKDAARSATVTAQVTIRPRFHGIRVAPSGRLRFVVPFYPVVNTDRPAGSFWAWTLVLKKERHTVSLKRLCLICLPAPFLQEKP